jgi:hypothetical protein
MKYLLTIDLWNPAVNYAVRTGQLKLQTGQWVKCGNEKKSRFVCVKPKSGTIWASHWQGDSKSTNERFKTLLEASKGIKKIA